ncbi:MAG: phosphoribosyl-ATP diphosphatase, partial [Rhizobiales bacterium]|nr:phosphoribosyl-ATP diphosphatase [Hyphomicrobiales bacterium]
MSDFSIEQLAEIIRARRAATGDTSYTRHLLDRGVAHIAQKVGEESTETVIAALSEDREALRDEAADLIYHLLVLLEARDIKIEDVVNELERRTGISG